MPIANKLTLEDKILLAKRSVRGEKTSELATEYRVHVSTVGYQRTNLPARIKEWEKKFPGRPVPEPGPTSAEPSQRRARATPAAAPTNGERDGAAKAFMSLLNVEDQLLKHMRGAETHDPVYLAAQTAFMFLKEMSHGNA